MSLGVSHLYKLWNGISAFMVDVFLFLFFLFFCWGGGGGSMLCFPYKALSSKSDKTGIHWLFEGHKMQCLSCFQIGFLMSRVSRWMCLKTSVSRLWSQLLKAFMVSGATTRTCFSDWEVFRIFSIIWGVTWGILQCTCLFFMTVIWNHLYREINAIKKLLISLSVHACWIVLEALTLMVISYEICQTSLWLISWIFIWKDHECKILFIIRLFKESFITSKLELIWVENMTFSGTVSWHYMSVSKYYVRCGHDFYDMTLHLYIMAMSFDR